MNLLIVSVGFLLYYILFRYKRRRLYELASRIPEPPHKFSIFGLLQYTYNAENLIIPMIKKFSLFCFNNGGYSRLWLGSKLYVGITHSEDTEYLLKNCLHKDDVMQLLKPVLGNGAFIAPVPEWSRRRKVLVPAFSPKVLNSFVDIISKRSQEIVHQISSENLVGCGQFSIWPYISQYTLRTVTETTLGIDLDTTRDQISEYLHAMSQIFRLATERVLHIWLWPNWLYSLTSQSKDLLKYSDIIYSLTNKIIQNKYKSLENYDRRAYNEQTIFGMDKNSELKSFLDHLIIISGNEGGFALKDIREDLLVLLLAGTDTSAVAICNTLKLLAKYPKIQEKVYAELEEVFGDSDRLLVKNDLKNIKYLDRVLKETLRLFPPVPIIVRSVTQETTLPSGVILPENAGVIVFIWGANRDPKVWGPDADCFDPDRYLKGTTPKIMSFSSGPRNCVGYQYAMMSIKISLIAILRHYKVVGEEESGPVPEIDCEFAIMMKAKDGYKVAFERR
ncbi:unnamed protein product [Colias eurytheme]|nr:unnamed protein product [Colias eurytheme]